MAVCLKEARVVESEARILLAPCYPDAQVGKGYNPLMECHIPSANIRVDRQKTTAMLNRSIFRLQEFLDTHPDIRQDDRHRLAQLSGKLETLRQISNGQQILPFFDRVERSRKFLIR